MAIKIIKFDLPINGTKVSTLEALRDNLTDEIVPLARSGQLERWFKSRQMQEQARAVAAAVSQHAKDKALFLALCAVLEVEVHPDDVSAIFDVPPEAGRHFKGGKYFELYEELKKSYEAMQENPKSIWESKITELKIPSSVGNSGHIEKWAVREGALVTAGQTLVTVETNKGRFDISATFSGIVVEKLLGNKNQITKNQLIAILYSLEN
ncbi:MAG: hypothetical protein PHU77_08320 [Simplicispira sp.]|nr:hypothetical protein [Simplicispira sp.]